MSNPVSISPGSERSFPDPILLVTQESGHTSQIQLAILLSDWQEKQTSAMADPPEREHPEENR